MPNQIERPSLDTTLESRYEEQRVGGAYDAKTAGKNFSNVFDDEFADGFTKGGQETGLPKKDSRLVQGLDTKKYKG